MESPDPKRNREKPHTDAWERRDSAPGEEIEDPLGNLVGDDEQEEPDDRGSDDDSDDEEPDE